MNINLKGKRLLVLDRTALAACAVLRAKELGVETIVANFYKKEDSPSKQVADISIDIDISDIDAMCQLVKDYHVDGIFVGYTDSHLPFYAEICERTGLPCCGTKEQFSILSNNKLNFKKACMQYGVPCVHEYSMDINFKKEDLQAIKYPVMCKPADGSGSRGVKRCNNEQELIVHYRELYASSASKNIICEEYIDSGKEIFLNYTIVDGVCSLSATYMCYDSILEDGSLGPAILHTYPSAYTQQYIDTVEKNVVRMFNGLGLKNCILSLQGFVTDEGFKFHETGLRMGGGQSYVFTKALRGISSLDIILEYSLTGKSNSKYLIENDNPFFEKPGVNYYISLKPGTINKIEGLNTVKLMPQVLQLSSFHTEGDVIRGGKSLDSVIYRIHVIDDTIEKLAKTLCFISSTIQVISVEGYEMQNERLTYERALGMLNGK